MTEERIREIIAEEIAKITISVSVSSDGYGEIYYVSADLRYDGSVVSEGGDSFRP